MWKVSVVTPTLEPNEWFIKWLEKFKEPTRMSLTDFHTSVTILPKEEFVIDDIVIETTKGLGKAVQKGLIRAKNDTVVVMDGDGLHPPTEIPKMVITYIHDKALSPTPVVVNMNRMSRQNIISKTGNRATTTLLGINTDDITGGFILGSKTQLMTMPQSTWRGYGDWCMELMFHASKRGWKISNVHYYPGDDMVPHKSHTNQIKHSITYSARAASLFPKRFKNITYPGYPTANPTPLTRTLDEIEMALFPNDQGLPPTQPPTYVSDTPDNRRKERK